MENLPYIQYYKGDDGQEFTSKLVIVSGGLGWAVNWLPLIIFHESSMDPAKVNTDSGAIGIIQFMPDTAAGLGTTTSDIAQMSGSQQLDLALQYYQQLQKAHGQAQTLADAYLLTFYPAAVGEAPDYVLGGTNTDGTPTTRALSIGKENEALDIGKKGYLTKSDITAHTNSWIA